jgi:aminoglycoside 2'-N-acetyltransferase I
VTSLARVHTVDLDAHALAEIRTFLDVAFEGDLSDEDWENTVGGLHVLAREGTELIGHAAVVQRRLVHQGIGLRTGYVEAVAVREDRRRRGIGGELMAIVEDIERHAYELGALSAAERALPLYLHRGWIRWEGPTWALSPEGPLRTKDDDGGVYILPTPASPPLDLSGSIACDWRPKDVW